jgi:hypothetical protein
MGVRELHRNTGNLCRDWIWTAQTECNCEMIGDQSAAVDALMPLASELPLI